MYMTIDDEAGLILEGGGMRGVFTCCVLDWFMDNGVRFPFAVGVSAGACNGLSSHMAILHISAILHVSLW